MPVSEFLMVTALFLSDDVYSKKWKHSNGMPVESQKFNW